MSPADTQRPHAGLGWWLSLHVAGAWLSARGEHRVVWHLSPASPKAWLHVAPGRGAAPFAGNGVPKATLYEAASGSEPTECVPVHEPGHRARAGSLCRAGPRADMDGAACGPPG